KPIPQDVVASAAHVPAGELSRRAAMLRAANVVRTGGARMADAIEPYHDRVREAVLARTSDARRRALHEALAIAYEASSRGDPETLATHWREAGNGSQAATYAESAGDAAAKTFAFDRAAQWFEQAIELAGDRPRRELRVKLGDALANAGRGALAAPHYEAAAEGAPRLDAIELRRRAADQLLRTGHFDRGVEASRALLAEIGVRLPTTAIGTIAMLVWWRLVAALRGLRFRARDAGQVTAEELVRFDVCFSLAMDIAMAETVVGAALHARAFVLALAIGEMERV